MILTECVYCNGLMMVELNEDYLNELKEGRQMVSKEVCEKCGKVNFVEHKRVGGETFGENDKRAKKLVPSRKQE